MGLFDQRSIANCHTVAYCGGCQKSASFLFLGIFSTLALESPLRHVQHTADSQPHHMVAVKNFAKFHVALAVAVVAAAGAR